MTIVTAARERNGGRRQSYLKGGKGTVLTAVDVQQILMQSSTVQKVQQTQQQHPDTEQKYLALQLSEARKLQQEKVSNAEEAERTLLRDKEDKFALLESTKLLLVAVAGETQEALLVNSHVMVSALVKAALK